MKIPSLFRTPRYQRFSIAPRYYDPVKEEMAERAAQIKRELSANGEEDMEYRSSRIAGAFRKTRSMSNNSASITQFIIMLMLAFLVFGYIYLGNIAVYIFATIATLFVYLKFRRII